MEINLMDVLRGILWNAAEGGLDMSDLMALDADTLDDWDNAVNTLALATPQRDLLAEAMGR